MEGRMEGKDFFLPSFPRHPKCQAQPRPILCPSALGRASAAVGLFSAASQSSGFGSCLTTQLLSWLAQHSPSGR